MNKLSVVRTIIRATSSEPVVFTTHSTCRIARELDDRRNHLYLATGLGMASSLGIGIAMQTRRRTVVVDSYASLTRNPIGLITAGTFTDLPLVHIVLDDSLFYTPDAPGSASGRADLCSIARAAGYSAVASTARLDRFAALLNRHLLTAAAPVLIRAVLSKPDQPAGEAGGTLLELNLPDHARDFGRAFDPGADGPLPHSA